MMTETVLHAMAMPEAEDLTGEIWTDLEHRLKSHDWFYAFSDDHRVWQSGELSRSILIKLMQQAVQIDPHKARKMFKRHAPPGCAVPA
jgi:6-phosphogluconate dehydrogenase (decarboxylating)